MFIILPTDPHLSAGQSRFVLRYQIVVCNVTEAEVRRLAHVRSPHGSSAPTAQGVAGPQLETCRPFIQSE